MLDLSTCSCLIMLGCVYFDANTSSMDSLVEWLWSFSVSNGHVLPRHDFGDVIVEAQTFFQTQPFTSITGHYSGVWVWVHNSGYCNTFLNNNLLPTGV